jgi:hypothetical protein
MVAVVLLLALAACANAPGLADLNADERARLAAMPVFNTNGLPQGSYRIVGSVASVACKDAFVESEAITRLKVQAVRLGADAIINLKFETRDELDWAHDCWSTVVGRGEAVRITDSGAEKQPSAGQ